MADVGMTIQLLETFRDRNMWKEGFMTHEDNRETRKNICGYAIETIKEQQAEIERLNALLKEQEAKPVKVKKNAYNYDFYYCPRCGRSFYETWFKKPKFCDKCGQAVMWD